MLTCTGCGAQVERAFRFCPWCAEPQPGKLTELFAAHEGVEGRRRALRVSRYPGTSRAERHVRFSVWSDSGPDRTCVDAAVSLDEGEAERLSRFLAASGEDAETETLAPGG